MEERRRVTREAKCICRLGIRSAEKTVSTICPAAEQAETESTGRYSIAEGVGSL